MQISCLIVLNTTKFGVIYVPRPKATPEAREIGRRIRSLREQGRLTREELAEKIDVTVGYLADVERGDAGISTKTLMLLCNILHCSADYILFGDRPRPSLDDRVANLPPELVALIDDLVLSQIKIYDKIRESNRQIWQKNCLLVYSKYHVVITDI